MIIEINQPKKNSSKYLAKCLKRNYSKIVSKNFPVEIRYFQTGKEIFTWRAREILKEQGVTGAIAIPIKDESVFNMVEWVTRFLNGNICVIVSERNLKVFTSNDKRAVEGLAYHVLGHIEDFNQRNILTSFPLWIRDPTIKTIEEKEIAQNACWFCSEYFADKIVLERKGSSSLATFREKANLQGLLIHKKKVKNLYGKTIKPEILSKKDYFLSVDISGLAYRMAWLKYSRELYLEVLEPLEKEHDKISLEIGIEALTKRVQTWNKYSEELEGMLLKEDVKDWTGVMEIFQKFLKEDTTYWKRVMKKFRRFIKQ